MAEKPKKVDTTCEDVLSLFTDGRNLKAPLGTQDIARAVAEARGGDWHDPYALLSRTALVHLLEEMALGGALVVKTGDAWSEEGVRFFDQRPHTRYWTTAALDEKWRQEREEAERTAKAKDRQERAERLATIRLRELHKRQYADLVNEYLAAYDKVEAENPELFEKR